MFDYYQFCMTLSLEKLFHMDTPYPSEILACFSTHCKNKQKSLDVKPAAGVCKFQNSWKEG